MQQDYTVTMNLLDQWGYGDISALNKLVKHVYHDIQGIARALMSRERYDHTLTPCALINELYLQLINRKYTKLNDRMHLLSILALELRRILIAHARKKNAAKRKPGEARMEVHGFSEQISAMDDDQYLDLIALEKALLSLHAMDPETCQIVELRVFAGFTVTEIAQTLNITERTVYRRWAWSQNWLYKELNG